MSKSRRRALGIALLVSSMVVSGQSTIASADVPMGSTGAAFTAPAKSLASVGATQVELAADEEAQLRSFFNDYDVAIKDQNSLIMSYENGNLWLSMSPEAVPVEVRTEEAGGLVSTVSRYADGSVMVESASVAADGATQVPGEIAPLGVVDCSASGSVSVVTYSNCLADVNNGLVRMNFRFTWRLYVGSSASITSFDPNSLGGHCIGCIVSDRNLYRISATDVRYSATIQTAAFQYTGWMGARVSTSGASVYQGP